MVLVMGGRGLTPPTTSIGLLSSIEVLKVPDTTVDGEEDDGDDSTLHARGHSQQRPRDRRAARGSQSSSALLLSPSQLPSILRQPRFGSSAVALPSGLVLLLGGAGSEGMAIERIEMLDCTTREGASTRGSLVMADWADVGGVDLMEGRGRVLACCAAIYADQT